MIDPSFRGLLTLLFRQKFRFLIVFACVVAAGSFYVRGLVPQYMAYGSILVKFDPDAAPRVHLASPNQPGFSDSERNELIQAHLKILASPALLNDVVTGIGTQKLYPDLESPNKNSAITAQAVARLSRAVKATNDPRNNVIDIRMTHTDPQIAQVALRLLMDRFMIRQQELYSNPQTDFLQVQTTKAQASMIETQTEFQNLKQTLGISDLGTEMDELLREKRELSALAYQAVNTAQNRLAELESKRVDALATYNRSSPTVTRLNALIQDAKNDVKRRQQDLTEAGNGGPLYTRLTQIDTRISYLEDHRNAYETLEQRLKIDSENYKYYHQRSEEARVNDLLAKQNMSRLVMMEEPVRPTTPLSQHKNLLLITFLCAGFLLAALIAFLSEMIDDRITRAEQITAALSLPVLESFWRHEKNSVTA